tara:strand:- start:901 stop:1164 length:264 start_codon:yes stop_codon:yes gene_type:complete
MQHLKLTNETIASLKVALHHIDLHADVLADDAEKIRDEIGVAELGANDRWLELNDERDRVLILKREAARLIEEVETLRFSSELLGGE